LPFVTQVTAFPLSPAFGESRDRAGAPIRSLMNLSVQNVNGAAQWVQRREWTPPRETPSVVDSRDQFVASVQEAAGNPYDKVIDRLRTAALRSDAVATAAQKSPDADGAPDDSAVRRRTT
jgi:hypothetical protein